MLRGREPTIEDEDRARGLYPYGEQRSSYYGAIYASGYDRAAMAEPIWTCDHDHGHPAEAERCALAEIERRGEKSATPWLSR